MFERKAQPSNSHVSIFTTGQRNKVPQCYRENKVRDTSSALKVEVGFAILNNLLSNFAESWTHRAPPGQKGLLESLKV